MDSTELNCIALGVDEEKTKRVLENFTKKVKQSFSEKSSILIKIISFSSAIPLICPR